jgi:ribosomal protein L28
MPLASNISHKGTKTKRLFLRNKLKQDCNIVFATIIKGKVFR